MKKLAGFSNFIKSLFNKSSDHIRSNSTNKFLSQIQSKTLGLNTSFNNYPGILNYFFQNKKQSEKDKEYENNHDRGYRFNSSSSSILEGMNLSKIYCLFGLFTIMAYQKINCYPASDKEIEKIRTNLENQIKNLEFKYHGKLRRQPIK
jgi:hypothetical protein